MEMYHSRLTQDDLNDLIIKYKIPRDLHPRLPSEEFVMSELSNDAIDRTGDDFHWKSGFFLIDRLAISYSMVWIHPNAAIDDPRPAAGSFSMADVRRLSAHVPMEMTGSEVQEEPHHDIRLTFQRLPFYCTPPADVDTVILDPTPADLTVGTPNAKIFTKAEAS
ncbi:hypothetical protein Tco_1156700 [Tanacetum coccineum]